MSFVVCINATNMNFTSPAIAFNLVFAGFFALAIVLAPIYLACKYNKAWKATPSLPEELLEGGSSEEEGDDIGAKCDRTDS